MRTEINGPIEEFYPNEDELATMGEAIDEEWAVPFGGGDENE